jgi:DNA-binding MarR family transcriptional regulator
MSHSSEIGLAVSNIGMLIVAARRSIRQLVASRIVHLDLTPHHFWMLLVIQRAAPLSLGELAKAMWMDNPTVSRMVQQMTQRGYLQVGPDPNHGRRIRIRLTPEGALLCEELSGIARGLEERSEKALSGEETTNLRELLSRVMRNLDQMLASDFQGLPVRAGAAQDPDKLPSVS